MRKVVLLLGGYLLSISAVQAQTTIPASSMSLSGYVSESNGMIKTSSSSKAGTATKNFSGVSGRYDIELVGQLENDGAPKVELRLAGSLKGTFHFPMTASGGKRSFFLRGISVQKGDSVQIKGVPERGALARVEKIVFYPISVPPSPTPNPISTGGLPIIPGGAGYGINTPAGRGGAVVRVTNLNDSGAGSLRACAEAQGPRVCVFDTSGTIQLSKNIVIDYGNLTIAGQTAPRPGITLRHAGIHINASDVLIQHFAIRVGADLHSSVPFPNGYRRPPNGPNHERDRDAIVIGTRGGSKHEKDINNVVIDHMSLTWATDEVLSIYGYYGRKVSNVTISNSIIAEALDVSIHTAKTNAPVPEHSAGILIADHVDRVAILNNIIAKNAWRNPRIGACTNGSKCLGAPTNILVANNIIHNTRGGTQDQVDIDINEVGRKGSVAVIGNHMTHSSVGSPYLVAIRSKSTGARVFVSGNFANGRTDQKAITRNLTSSSSVVVSSSPIANVPGFVAKSHSVARTANLEAAGARPAERDIVDDRIVADVRSNRGQIIDWPSDVGGWPNLRVVKQAFDTSRMPASSSGYTGLEIRLHEAANLVEGK